MASSVTQRRRPPEHGAPPASQADWDAIVIGSGPAGLTAAAEMGRRGIGRLLVIERAQEAGGVPRWYTSMRTFGLLTFKRLLSGREFADRLLRRALAANVTVRTGTHVLQVNPGGGNNRHEVVTVSEEGVRSYFARALVLATGCREANRAASQIVGGRPAGIFNTASALHFIDGLHALPGSRVVVLGSEFVAFSAARMFQMAGARVEAVIEEHPYPLGDWLGQAYFLWPGRIALRTGLKVVDVEGDGRLSAVIVAPVGGDGHPLMDRRERLECDTLIVSGTFVPNAELCWEAGIETDPHTGGPVVDERMETSVPGIFACGNILRGAESADYVVREGRQIAAHVADFLEARGGQTNPAPHRAIPLRPGKGIGFVLPQRLSHPEAARDGMKVHVRPRNLVTRTWITAEAGGQRLGRRFCWRATPVKTVSVKLRLPPSSGSGSPITVGVEP